MLFLCDLSLFSASNLVVDRYAVLTFLRSLHHPLLMGSFVSKYCSRSESSCNTMCNSHADLAYIQLVPGNKCHSSLYFHCLVLPHNLSCLVHFLEVTLRDLLYFTVCLVLLIMNDVNWTTGLLFLFWSTGRSQHQRLFMHHVRTGPLHMIKLFSSWIFTSRQLHNVTSGRMTVSFFRPG